MLLVTWYLQLASASDLVFVIQNMKLVDQHSWDKLQTQNKNSNHVETKINFNKDNIK